MEVEIQQFEGEAFVAIPEDILRKLNLQVDDPLDIAVENGCIVIQPLGSLQE